MTTEDRQAAAAQAYDEAGKTAGKATMYALAECARKEHPDATEVVLSESDQGSWLWVDHVVTQEDDLARREEVELEEDDGLASCLYSDIYSLRELYSEFDVRGEIEYSRRQGITSFRMDVAKVLAECAPTPVENPHAVWVEVWSLMVKDGNSKAIANLTLHATQLECLQALRENYDLEGEGPFIPDDPNLYDEWLTAMQDFFSLDVEVDSHRTTALMVEE